MAFHFLIQFFQSPNIQDQLFIECTMRFSIYRPNGATRRSVQHRRFTPSTATSFSAIISALMPETLLIDAPSSLDKDSNLMKERRDTAKYSGAAALLRYTSIKTDSHILIVLLAMTNWDRILLLLAWFYSAASHWITTSTILAIYGLVLLYLLLVVHKTPAPPIIIRKHGQSMLVPYYDKDGQLQGWVREEQEIRKSNGMSLQSRGQSQTPIYRTAAGLAEQLSAPLLRDRGMIPLPPSRPEGSSQTDAVQFGVQMKS
ncbi:hypothetical protein B0H13DRAFT_1867644 [Mycena leptocephala]|nr:hypothetical protein B0H13DRAFT_1867644 [Mycena leptocephala]